MMLYYINYFFLNPAATTIVTTFSETETETEASHTEGAPHTYSTISDILSPTMGGIDAETTFDTSVNNLPTSPERLPSDSWSMSGILTTELRRSETFDDWTTTTTTTTTTVTWIQSTNENVSLVGANEASFVLNSTAPGTR